MYWTWHNESSRAQEWLTCSFICLNQVGIYLPCYDIIHTWFEEFTAKNYPAATPYIPPLVAGALGRSLACTTCYPIELARTRMQVFKLVIHISNFTGLWLEGNRGEGRDYFKSCMFGSIFWRGVRWREILLTQFLLPSKIGGILMEEKMNI